MSNEESTIFFGNFPYVPYIIQNHSNFPPISKKDSWKKVVSTEVPGLRVSPNVSTKFSKLIMNELFVSAVTFEVIEATKGGQKLESWV